MGVLTRLRAAALAVPSPAGNSVAEKSCGGFPSAGYLPALGSLPTASGLLVRQATSLQVSTVNACVRIRSRDLARCTPQVLQIDGKGNKTQVLDHPLTALFKRPNRAQTWFEFAEQLHVAFLLRSNAYAVILRNWRGDPVELIPLNPDLVTVMEAPDGSIFYTAARAGMWLAAVLAGEAIVIQSEDVLHVRDLTFNSLVGVSRIALARDAIGLAMVQEQQASRWAGNGARPAGVLQSKKTLTQAAADRFKQQWSAMQDGIQNVGRTAVLEDGVEWKAMQLSSVDLEFMQARLTQVKEIARFFEVPLHKLGENESLPRASIAELNADYVQNVVMSDATRWEQKIEATFAVTAQGYEIKFDERGLLRADLATMINSARAGVLSGLITQNEGRAYIGYGPLDNADALLAPVNLAPNGSAMDGVAPDGAGRPRDGNLPGAAEPSKGAAEPSQAMVTAIAKAVAAALRSYNPNQARDDHGRFAGGEDDDGDNDRAASRAAISHEVKLIVQGLVITAVAAIAVALAPEGGAIATVAGLAGGAADAMFQRAGLSAALEIAKELGLDTSEIDRVHDAVASIFKGVDPQDSDPQDAKRTAILKQRLAAVLAFARDELLAKVEADHPDTPRRAAVTEAIEASYHAALGKLDALTLGEQPT